MRITARFIVFTGIFLFFSSGVYRHDVNKEEYLKLASQKQFDCVGRIFNDTIPKGSCILISGKYVLTAAHCLIETQTRPDTMEYNGMQLVMYTPVREKVIESEKIRIQFGTAVYQVKKLHIPPAYLDSATKGSCDIAVLELTEQVRNIKFPELSSAFDELHSNVIAVGYGASGPANQPGEIESMGAKTAGENIIDSISGPVYNAQPTLLLADLDDPDEAMHTYNRLGSPIPLALEYMPSGGDSGGGLFRKVSDNWELIGICSGIELSTDQFLKTGYYYEIGQWTRVSVFRTWILDKMAGN